jgi:hypothetical protein
VYLLCTKVVLICALNEFALLINNKKQKLHIVVVITMRTEIHCPHYMIDYKTYVKTNHSTSFIIIILALRHFNLSV